MESEAEETTTESTASVSEGPLEMIHQRQTTLIRKHDVFSVGVS